MIFSPVDGEPEKCQFTWMQQCQYGGRTKIPESVRKLFCSEIFLDTRFWLTILVSNWLTRDIS